MGVQLDQSIPSASVDEGIKDKDNNALYLSLSWKIPYVRQIYYP